MPHAKMKSAPNTLRIIAGNWYCQYGASYDCTAKRSGASPVPTQPRMTSSCAETREARTATMTWRWEKGGQRQSKKGGNGGKDVR